MAISKHLLVKNIDGYTYEDAQQKTSFHRAGQNFLKKVAAQLLLPNGSYDIRVCRGGPAVSGEVILHSDDIYIQLFESCLKPGVQVLFRTCYKRTDYTGDTNCFTSMVALKDGETYTGWLVRLKGMIEHNRAKHGVNRI